MNEPSRWAPLARRAAAGALVGLVAAGAAAPTFSGWFHRDDFQNMRWAIEHRRSPWVALTELPALHDHVRPLSLLGQWAGAHLSNGAWWGPHVVLVALVAATALGSASLARRLTGSAAAGVMAGSLTCVLTATREMLSWNAWLATAGEAAAGLWAVVVAMAAVSRASVPLAMGALALVGAAGLFKEPGWFVAPAALGALAWTARRAGRASRASDLLGVAVPIGLAGFALAWHPYNVPRMQLGAGLLPTAWDGLRAYGRAHVAGTDPFGVPAPLVAFAFAVSLAPERDGRPDWRVGLAGGVAGTALFVAAPDWIGVAIAVLALATCIRRRSAPPVALVLLLVSLAVMLPRPRPLAPYTTVAGAALAVWVAEQGAAAWRAWGDRRGGAAIVGLGAALAVVTVGLGLSRPVVAAGDPADEDALMSLAAFSRAIGAAHARAVGPHAAISPLVGPDLMLVSPAGPREVGVQLGADTVLYAPRATFEAAMAGHEMLAQGQRKSKVAPGWYAGVVTGRPQSGLSVRDGCGERQRTTKPAAGEPAAVAALLFEVAPGCEELTIETFGAPGDFWLVPLDPPRAYDLRRARLTVYTLHGGRAVSPEAPKAP